MSYQAGSTTTLTSEWYTFPGGPASSVTSVHIAIEQIGGGEVVAATTVGVTNPSTGVYAYQWAIGEDQDAGDYLITWTAVDSDLDNVQATEVVSVIALSAGSWTSPAQVLATTGVTVSESAVHAAQSIIDIYSNITTEASGSVSARDVRLLGLATCYQAVWMVSQVDVFTRTDVDSVTQDGATFSTAHADALELAPLAKRCLDRLSWRKSRSSQVRPGKRTTYSTIEAWQDAWLRDGEGTDSGWAPL